MLSVRILEVKSLGLSDVKVIRFGRFRDHRGYFSEHARKSDLLSHPDLGFMNKIEFLQCNESWSRPGTVRGLHFQWNPYMGKLVRTLSGRMVDMVLDIRKGSPDFGRIILYEMPADANAEYGEWIWVPPGFAHGNYFDRESHIEYFCSGEYSPGCEAGISPLAQDIDWSLCDPQLRKEFDRIVSGDLLISEKDRDGQTLEGWLSNPASEQFVFGNLP